MPLSNPATSSGADGALLDGVNSAIKATVLDYTNSNPLAVTLVNSSGTALATTSEALNVSIASATNITTGPSYQTATGTITTSTGTVQATVQQYGLMTVKYSGTYAGATLNFEQSFDSGSTWDACPMTLLSVTPSQAVIAVSPSSNATAVYQGNIGSATTFRVRASALTSGTVSFILSNTTDPILFNVNASIVNTPSIATVTTLTGGGVANDGVDSGNPIKIGGQARTTNPTAVADADRVNFIADKLGKQIVVGAIRDLKGVQNTTITSSTSETTIVTAVASTFLDLYGLIIANTSATACEVTIKDATAGTTRCSFEVPATDTRGFMVPVDSGIPQAAVNNNWTATCGTSVASIKITALYVKNI